MKTKIIALAAFMLLVTSFAFAQPAKQTLPDAVVRNLYAARKRLLPVSMRHFGSCVRAMKTVSSEHGSAELSAMQIRRRAT